MANHGDQKLWPYKYYNNSMKGIIGALEDWQKPSSRCILLWVFLVWQKQLLKFA